MKEMKLKEGRKWTERRRKKARQGYRKKWRTGRLKKRNTTQRQDRYEQKRLEQDWRTDVTQQHTKQRTASHRPASLRDNHLRPQFVKLIPQRLHLERRPRVQQLGVHRQGTLPLARRGVRRHANVFRTARRCLTTRIIAALVAGTLQACYTHTNNDAVSTTQV